MGNVFKKRYNEKNNILSPPDKNSFYANNDENMPKFSDLVHLPVLERHVVENRQENNCNFLGPIFWHCTKNTQYGWVYNGI